MNSVEFWLLNGAISAGIVLMAAVPAMAVLRNPARRQRLGELAVAGAITALLLSAFPNVHRIFLGLLPEHTLTTPSSSHTPFHIGLPTQTKVTGQPSGITPVHQAGGPDSQWTVLWRQHLARWPDILAVAYLLGSLAMTGRLVLGWILLKRTAAQAIPLALERDSDIPCSRGTPWSRSRKAVILVSDDVRTPTAFGIFHPVILLPGELMSAGRDTIHIAVTHELAHVAQGDTISRVMMALASTLLFYNPLFWILRGRVRLCQEFLADQTAARTVPSLGVYVEIMIGLAQSIRRRNFLFSPAAGLIGGQSDFYLRMNRLLETGKVDAGIDTCSHRWLGGAAVGMVMVILPASMLTLGSPQTANSDHHKLPGTSADIRRRAQTLVYRGLDYLGRKQNANGAWLGRYGPAVTALALRGYLEAGISEKNWHVRRGLRFIEMCHHADGGFYGDVEPTYNTAIVLRTLSMLPQGRYQRQARLGLTFLHRQLAKPKGTVANTPSGWFTGQSVYKSWPADGDTSTLANGHNRTATAQITAGLLISPTELDPAERSADTILDNYGHISYAELKSMIYAGLSPRDPRVVALSRWIGYHYNLRDNPATHSSLGLYYYYVVFARTLRASGQPTVRTSSGIRHNWRRDMVNTLAWRCRANGSWINRGNSAWLEGNPIMATTYAVLALDQVTR